MSVAYRPAVQTDCVVDLSHNQRILNPEIAFQTAKLSGVAMIIHKATQGTGMVDETYAERKAAAAAVGLLWGAYHFCDGSDAASQVSHFLGTVGEPYGLLAIDAEKNASQVSVAQVCQIIYQICQKTGHWPLLYMGRSGPDGTGAGLDAESAAYLAQCDLWLPEYGNNPIPPIGFSKWALHQYTGDGINGPGNVAGIGTHLDRSYFAGSVADLQAWFSKATA